MHNNNASETQNGDTHGYIFLLILFTLHDENGVAMTKAHVVDYILKW